MAKVLVEKPDDRLEKLTKEPKTNKNIRNHVKMIRNHIVKDFMAKQIRLNNKTLSSTRDIKLKSCIDMITKTSSQIDHTPISPFYLTYHESDLQPKIRKNTSLVTTNNATTTAFSSNHPLVPQKNKGNVLYATFMRKQWKNLMEPKNKTTSALSIEKLAKIRTRYRVLMKNARSIQRFSQRKCSRFKKDWTMCANILKEVEKGQEKFEDPEVNFDFYIWQASKLCEVSLGKLATVENEPAQ